jgi:fatty-acyl-CoA synthase
MRKAHVPRGEKGELLTRGYSVMQGYWGDPEKPRKPSTRRAGCTRATWPSSTRTAFCSIVGRSKDMVIRGGENIYPREVEEFLYRHPSVLDVQCVGVPDAKYGEELCACIILRPGTQATSEDIRAFAMGRSPITRFPATVRFVEEFR